jgi:hypothetical protein
MKLPRKAFPRKLEELPALPGSQRFWRKVPTLVVVIGVTIGIFGAVRSGSVLVALGCAFYSYNAYARSAAKRKVELIIPVVAALVLLALAFTLPHAR